MVRAFAHGARGRRGDQLSEFVVSVNVLRLVLQNSWYVLSSLRMYERTYVCLSLSVCLCIRLYVYMYVRTSVCLPVCIGK